MHAQIDSREPDRQHKRGPRSHHRPAPAGLPSQNGHRHCQSQRDHRVATGKAIIKFRCGRLPQMWPQALKGDLRKFVGESHPTHRDREKSHVIEAAACNQSHHQRPCDHSHFPPAASMGDEDHHGIARGRGLGVDGLQERSVPRETASIPDVRGRPEEQKQRSQHRHKKHERPTPRRAKPRPSVGTARVVLPRSRAVRRNWFGRRRGHVTS